MVGRTFLNYRITEKLGAGGQGTVYKAVDERLGRPVVIKVLSPELTAREVNLKRLQREAALASSLLPRPPEHLHHLRAARDRRRAPLHRDAVHRGEERSPARQRPPALA